MGPLPRVYGVVHGGGVRLGDPPHVTPLLQLVTQVVVAVGEGVGVGDCGRRGEGNALRVGPVVGRGGGLAVWAAGRRGLVPHALQRYLQYEVAVGGGGRGGLIVRK